jgi:lysophospholipase L1-like esterase
MAFFDVSLTCRARLQRLSLGAAAVLSGMVLAASFCAAANPPANHAADPSWVATWGAAMMSTGNGARDFSGQTVRQIVHASVGGEQTRVWFSNRFGSEPLHIGAAHIALSADKGAIQPGSDRTLTFHDAGSVLIPPGATVVSDPVALNVPALSNLAVSLYLPDHTRATTFHGLSSQTSYAATGNLVDASDLGTAEWPVTSWYFLTGVDVDAPGDSAIITLGDSITDGSRSKFDTNHRWPDFLAARLAQDANTQKAGVLGVVDVGISGNRVLLNHVGPSAVSRVNWDVLARSGARYLIVLESINDIARYSDNHQPYGDLEKRLEWGLAQIAAQAHQHGMLVFGATLTPYGNCVCATPEGMAVRQSLNQWISTTHDLDGVIDFAGATSDPQHPSQYLPQYDSDDHVHPSEAGYRAMANAVDLTLFTKQR